MNVVILQYNAGNTQSVYYALQRCGVTATITNNPEEIRRADKVIFPGVGAAASAMEYLNKKGLTEMITSLTQPVLGICLGMQLLCASSEEGDIPCMGIFDQPVQRFVGGEKIPHTGWNSIHGLQSPLFNGVADGAFVYFVHSYYAGPGGSTIATAHYIHDYAAALHRNNFYAVQFHPEKSGPVGQQILQNFLSL